MFVRLLATFLLFFVSPCIAYADYQLELNLPRNTYWRGETIRSTVTCKNRTGKTIPAAVLKISCQEWLTNTISVPEIKPNEQVKLKFTLSTRYLRSGRTYPLLARFVSRDDQLNYAETSKTISLIEKPNAERLEVWQWLYGGPLEIIHTKTKTKAQDLGFTAAGGPVFPYSPPKADPAKQLQTYRKSMESAMKRGMDISICPVGIWYREYNLIQPEGTLPLIQQKSESDKPADPHADPRDDTRYKGAGRNGHHYFNPFHTAVARQQNYANELMMQVLGDFPNLKYAFLDAEFVDDVYYHNANSGGLKLMKQMLGFTRDEIGPAKYVAQGILADDDRGLKYRRYVYQHGNGVNLALQRAADAIHKHRPDIKFLSDPYRSVALLDMFPGCDYISTWTYTNPDPKLMLYIETLRAVCKPSGQEPLHVVTLLNYPGEVVPEKHDKNWVMMGPGRLVETTWINLSRAPKAIGYYAFDSYYKSKLADSPETLKSLAMLNQRVFEPFGPMFRKLEISPRRIAVLSSESSRLYNKSPGLLGYPNYQPYHFYTVMAMAHLNADVVFDETIERYGLKDYEVLVLPKCDVLTKTVYDRILKFQQRGGLVIADQYLGAKIPNVIPFDFDFTHRRKVNANAIATGKIYIGSGQDDHILPGKSAMEKVKGVTAKQDQLILESYAKQLRTKLKNKVEPDYWCDQHDVLLNVLEKNGVKYLVLINDKREYDNRTGPYKAVMEKLVPQSATLNIKQNVFNSKITAYDLLSQQVLSTQEQNGIISLKVKLGEAGGTILALTPYEITTLEIDAPTWATAKSDLRIRIRLKDQRNNNVLGLQPLQIQIINPAGKQTAASHYACAENGGYEFPLVTAVNDPIGKWMIKVQDLTTGKMVISAFEVRKSQ